MRTINAIQLYWRGWFSRPGPDTRIDMRDWRQTRDWSYTPKTVSLKTKRSGAVSCL